MARVSIILFCSLLISGCAGLKQGSSNGSDGKLNRALSKSLFDIERTIIPVVAGTVFAAADIDEHFSDWATDHNPIFGSEATARDVSDVLYGFYAGEAFITYLYAPASRDSYCAKVTDIASKGGGAFLATLGTTKILKNNVHRYRPNGRNRRSFPSGHTSSAFSLSKIAHYNLGDYKNLPDCAREPLRNINRWGPWAVAWARVEGRKHYPSDVLFGAAIGNAITTFVQEYFFDSKCEDWDFQVSPTDRGVMAQLAFSF